MVPRLDTLLVEQGHFSTRSRARDAIVRGTVAVDGVSITKPGFAARDGMTIEITDPAARYVSRAALKLVSALDHFGFDPSGCTAIDVGASTGGFTQVLLERGASHVFAVDVGSGQLASSLASDPRVTRMEGTNARHLDTGETSPFHAVPITAIVSDVSFISLELALPPALDVARLGSFAALLVKPQFEVGREHIGKGGLVSDPAIAVARANQLRDWLDRQPGWRAVGLVLSPIQGSDGNNEFLLGGVKDRV
ncbi:MAG: TlyA family RNA methyltransferase [Pseudomonadota bacterium]